MFKHFLIFLCQSLNLKEKMSLRPAQHPFNCFYRKKINKGFGQNTISFLWKKKWKEFPIEISVNYYFLSCNRNEKYIFPKKPSNIFHILFFGTIYSSAPKESQLFPTNTTPSGQWPDKKPSTPVIAVALLLSSPQSHLPQGSQCIGEKIFEIYAD